MIARSALLGLMLLLTCIVTIPLTIGWAYWIVDKSRLHHRVDGAFLLGLVLGYFYLAIMLAIKPRLLTVPFATAIILILTAALGPSKPVQRLPTAVLDFIGGIAVIGVFGLISGNLISPLLNYRRVANGLLIKWLIILLSNIELNPSKWNELPFRMQLAHQVEHVAIIFDRDVAKFWRSSDLLLNQWISSQIHLISAEVRGLKKWLITPRSDTREHLAWRLRDLLVCIADNNWDGIPRQVSENILSENPWRPRIWRTVTVLTTALVPIGAVWALERFGAFPNESARSYFVFGAFLWMAVTIITALDPLYAAKLDAIKSVLPLVGKKKD